MRHAFSFRRGPFRPLALTCAVAIALLAPVRSLAQRAHPVGTDAATLSREELGEATFYDENWLAVPLKGKTPDWFTPQLREELAASPTGVLAAPADAPLPGEVGIRPGSWMIAPSGCTMNFIFQKRGAYAIGTAGHCAKVGDEVTLLTLAPNSGNPVLVNIGKVVTSKDAGVGNDFALVSIRPELNDWVFPTMSVVGGPCGAFYGSGAQTIFHYGHGLGIGTGGTPRAGVGLGWKTDAFGWASPAIYGDSGSAVRIGDLKAAGDLTHLLVFVGRFPDSWLQDWAGTGSVIGGTRIGKMLQIASGYSLVSSPVCPPGS